MYKRLRNRYSKSGDNTFISFTAIDKLGINPNSVYNTPLGVYSYPVKYVLNHINSAREDMEMLPFAGDMEYANIFEGSRNIVDLNEMTPEEANTYYKKIVNWALKHKNIDENTSKYKWKEVVDKIEYIINNASDRARFSSSVGGRFWYVMMKVAAQFGGESRTQVKWNHLFRYIGIDGCIDNGVGIIHGSEPNQAVFFSMKSIKNNERVFNKWSEDSIYAGKTHSIITKIRNLRGGRRPDIERYILDNPKANQIPARYIYTVHAQTGSVDEIPEDILIKGVLIAPNVISLIKNPSEKVQLAAVRQNGMVIKYIKNPSEKVQLAAEKQNPNDI